MHPPSIRTLLLADAIGAGLSAALHGLVLPMLEDWIHMPRTVLLSLAVCAILFLAHDLLGLIGFRGRERPWLQRILVANALYCLATTGLVLWHYPRLTTWDLLYFVPEILVILALVRVEWRAVKEPEALA